MITKKRLIQEINGNAREFLKICHYLQSEELEEILKMRINSYNLKVITELTTEQELFLFDYLKGFVYGKIDYTNFKERVKNLLK